MRRTGIFALATLLSCLVVIGSGRSATRAADFTNRQIFEGVMFGSGPVASLLPEARDQLRPEIYVRSAGELARIGKARSTLIERIGASHPEFLAAFGTAARSGDPVRVQAMVARARVVISEAMRARPAGSPGILDNLPIRDSRAGTAVALLDNLPIRDSRAGTAVALLDNLPVSDSRAERLPALDRLNPAWSLFSSRLFTEQLAGSVAIALGAPVSGQ